VSLNKVGEEAIQKNLSWEVS